MVVLPFLSFGPAGPVGSADGCEARLNLLVYDTQQATSLSSATKTTLSQYGRSALDAYRQGKIQEALQQLNNYQAGLNQFYYTPAPSISAMDFLRLSANLSTTKHCLQPQQTREPAQQLPKDTIRK
ncbi:hypothetical protein GCM10023187_02390 [Nibrella viscosa]|uniref:Uncharacterized protein n=2 Tax=Nibrella viscosa TaxID=1084524 RepID=A0ABP8JSL4_9BACT